MQTKIDFLISCKKKHVETTKKWNHLPLLKVFFDVLKMMVDVWNFCLTTFEEIVWNLLKVYTKQNYLAAKWGLLTSDKQS